MNRNVLVILTVFFSLAARADFTSVLPDGIRPELNLPGSQQTQHSASASVLNILDYVRQNMTRDSIAELDNKNPGYNRREQFGGWISTDGCIDTRSQILIRSNDSSAQIKYKDWRKCSVTRGLWHDPYAGNDYKLAKSIQIDHVVPLKHTYLTGGKKWAPEKRCYYANFTHNSFHLLAVAGHENMSKSDKSPEYYLPPNDAYQCQYISSWMKVKAVWQLISTPEEVDAIEEVIRTHRCSVSKLQMSAAQLAAEREAVETSVPVRCKEFGYAQRMRAAQLDLPFDR